MQETVNDLKLVEVALALVEVTLKKKELTQNEVKEVIDSFFKEAAFHLNALEKTIAQLAICKFCDVFQKKKYSQTRDQEMFEFYPPLKALFLKTDLDNFLEEYHFSFQLEILEVSPYISDEKFRKKKIEEQMLYYEDSLEFFGSILSRFLEKVNKESHKKVKSLFQALKKGFS